MTNGAMCQLPSVQLTYEDDLERKNGGPSGTGGLWYTLNIAYASCRKTRFAQSICTRASHLSPLI